MLGSQVVQTVAAQVKRLDWCYLMKVLALAYRNSSSTWCGILIYNLEAIKRVSLAQVSEELFSEVLRAWGEKYCVANVRNTCGVLVTLKPDGLEVCRAMFSYRTQGLFIDKRIGKSRGIEEFYFSSSQKSINI